MGPVCGGLRGGVGWVPRSGWVGCLSVLVRNVVRGFFDDVGGGVILPGAGGAGRWAIILGSLDSFLIFLISYILSRSTTVYK